MYGASRAIAVLVPCRSAFAETMKKFCSRDVAPSSAEGGFEALVSGEVPLGRIVTIEFYLDGVSDLVPLSARVINHHGFTIGFQFIAPTSLQRSIIADFFYEELHSEPL
jgi:PilZ domain-containing protein